MGAAPVGLPAGWDATGRVAGKVVSRDAPGQEAGGVGVALGSRSFTATTCATQARQGLRAESWLVDNDIG
jgi:hypothetical protein